MKADSICNVSGRVLSIKVIGPVEGHEILDLSAECYPKFEFKHIVWDFRDSSLSGLSADAFRTLAHHGAKYAERRGSGAKTALLVNTKAEIALSRAFADTVATIVPTRFAAFLDEDEMKAWIAD